MAYDALAESRKLLADGVPDGTYSLSRRRRFIPAAFDIDGDVAATLFVRRGVSGTPCLDTWALEKRDGEWTMRGGGSGEGYDEIFDARDSLDGVVTSHGSGWTIRGGGGILPWLRRGISHAEMRLAPSVASLQVGPRRIEVPDHGLAIVVWTSRRPPHVMALSVTGEPIAPIALRDPTRPRAHLRPRGQIRSPGGWTGYPPSR